MATFGTVWKALDHSLVAVAVGALVIPFAINRLNDADRVKEGRQRLAVAILDNGFRGERDVNALTTSLAFFQKDAAAVPAGARRSLQTETRSKVNEQYATFDRFIWWWCNQIENEAKTVRGVTEEEQQALHHLSSAYSRSVQTSMAWWDHLVESHLRGDPTKIGTEPFKAQSRILNEGLKKCGAARRELFSQMAYLFSANAKPNFARWALDRAANKQLGTCAAPD